MVDVTLHTTYPVASPTRVGFAGGLPKSALEFQARFATEDACRAYLTQSRWPDGFRCPHCGAIEGTQLATRRWRLRLVRLGRGVVCNFANVAPKECELRASPEGAIRDGRVRNLREALADSLRDRAEDHHHLAPARGRRRGELERAGRIPREDAVDHDDMKVHVEVQAATEALYERDGAKLDCIEADARSPCAVPGAQSLGEHPCDEGERGRVERGALGARTGATAPIGARGRPG